jgi:hypothetical protein
VDDFAVAVGTVTIFSDGDPVADRDHGAYVDGDPNAHPDADNAGDDPNTHEFIVPQSHAYDW